MCISDQHHRMPAPPDPEICNWVAVAPATDVAERAIIPVRVRGFDLIVVREHDNVWACQRLCPHEYADLLQGRVSGANLFCGRHRASFDLTSGVSGHGWDLPRLRIYAARIVDGQFEVDVAAVDADPPVRRQRLDAVDSQCDAAGAAPSCKSV